MAFDVVFFLPGICGSALAKGDETIWPGTPWDTVFRTYADEQVGLLAGSTELVATEVIRSVPLEVFGITVHHADGYGRALDSLERMGFGIPSGRLVPWAYDWRRDIRDTAAALHRRLSAADVRGKRIAIVAHSMGGLVARSMLEGIGIPAGVAIELCVLVAVPHLGAPVALLNVLGLRPQTFLTGRQCRDAMRNPFFPSGYQLLPPPGVPALLRPSDADGFSTVDAFGHTAIERLSLEPASVDAARSFSAGLAFMGPGFRPPCRYVVIAGNAQPTTSANYLDGPAGVRPVVEQTAGDGTVPLWSAAPPGIPVRYVSATHGSIFADRDTEALLRAVLTPGRPGGRLFSIEADSGSAVLSAQALESTVRGGSRFSIAIVADRPTESATATVEVTTAFAGGRMEHEEAALRYQGGFMRSMHLDFTAPTERSLMRFHVDQPNASEASRDATVLVID